MGKQKKKLFYSLGTAISIFCMIFCINLKVHAEGIIITPETFENYYSVDTENKTASLKVEVQANEIKFQGDFSDALAGKVNRIIVDRTNEYTGQDAVFKDVYFEVSADNVSISRFTFNNTGVGYGVKVTNCNGLDFHGNSLTVKTDTENDGYGIYAESSGNISVKDNYITFEGNTEGEATNFAVSVTGNSLDSSIEVSDNTFDISIVSCLVSWIEAPAGSGNWVSNPISGGLLFDSCHNLTVSKNTVNIKYNNVVGQYDTIYGINIRGEKRPKGGDNADIHVKENILTLNGNSYVYGLNIEQDDFEIIENEISVNSNNYSNGISLGENCVNGVVQQNNITAGVSEDGLFSIGLYAYMHDTEGITFAKNTIQLSGKIGYGIQCTSSNKSGKKLRIVENTVNGDGGCMAGISMTGSGSYEVKGNDIIVSGNATEKYEALDSFYNELPKTYGIAFTGENDGKSAVISDNMIQSSNLGIAIAGGCYEIEGNNITVSGNTVKSDAYGIYSESSGNTSVKGNYINFEGNTEGEATNFAVSVTGNSLDSSVEVSDNTFDISIASCYLPWLEVPEGSGNWVSKSISGGLLFDSCHNLTVSKNTVNIKYNKVVGSYDTIYGIEIRGEKRPEGSDNPDIHVKENKLTLNGNTYAYGMLIAQDDFEIIGNEVSVNSNYYANGISLGDNCVNGLVEQNSIIAGVSEDGVFSIGLCTNIYSVETEGITFGKNTIQLSGKIGYGIQCYSSIKSGNKLLIEDNIINGDGGCMAGIAMAGSGSYEVKGNDITVSGNAAEKYEAWDSFYNELPKTYGIAFTRGNDGKSIEIVDNKIQSSDLGIVSRSASVISGNEVHVQGEYAVDVYRDGKDESHASKVYENMLFAANRKGDSSVYGTNVDEVYNNNGKNISATVTFKVVNGSWNDGTGDAATADRTVTLTGKEGDTLKLAADQIPAVGGKPADTFKAGTWDVTPSAVTAISRNTTYTYTYAKKDTISATVTFKVVNGSWNDGTGDAATADRTVTLTGKEGDTLKLAADQIPAVGGKPSAKFKAGSWDVTPDVNTALTGNTTYTYTYSKLLVMDIFTDLKADAWYISALQFVYDNDIMIGKGEVFEPNASISREEFVQTLYSNLGKPEIDISNAMELFTDLKADKWYIKAVVWANKNNIAVGYGDRIFGVGKKISREELVQMLYKYAVLLGYKTDFEEGVSAQFADSDKIQKWAKKAMDWAVTNGIIGGKGEKNAPKSEMRIDPKGNATRAECAQMIKKLLQLAAQ